MPDRLPPRRRRQSLVVCIRPNRPPEPTREVFDRHDPEVRRLHRRQSRRPGNGQELLGWVYRADGLDDATDRLEEFFAEYALVTIPAVRRLAQHHQPVAGPAARLLAL